jgi:hypothetical protein
MYSAADAGSAGVGRYGFESNEPTGIIMACEAGRIPVGITIGVHAAARHG